MTEEKMTEFKKEGEPAFPENMENDNSTSSSEVEEEKETTTEQPQSEEGDKNSDEEKDASEEETEEKDTKEKDTEEDTEKDKDKDKDKDDDKGLADHPRWKEREQDWDKRFNDQETRHTGSLKELREEFEEKLKGKKETTKESSEVEVPEWWGGDEVSWKKYQSDQTDQREKVKKEVIDAIKDSKIDEDKKVKEATDYMNSEISDLEKNKELNPKGEKIDRNKLFRIVYEDKLVDTEGRWNYKAGFKIMKGQSSSPKVKNLKSKKDLANITTNDTQAEDQKSDVTTSTDFENPGGRPW